MVKEQKENWMAYIPIVTMFLTVATMLVSLGIFVQQSRQTASTLEEVKSSIQDLRREMNQKMDQSLADRARLHDDDRNLGERVSRIEGVVDEKPAAAVPRRRSVRQEVAQ